MYYSPSSSSSSPSELQQAELKTERDGGGIIHNDKLERHRHQRRRVQSVTGGWRRAKGGGGIDTTRCDQETSGIRDTHTIYPHTEGERDCW